MKINYKTNFSGYLSLPRAIQFLIKDKALNFTQLGIYICLIEQADFDRRHKKTYGVIIRDDEEIAKELNCDPTTIYRHRKQLIKKGFLVERDGLTVIPNFYMFEYEIIGRLVKLHYPVAKLHYLFAHPQISIATVQAIIAKLQEQQPQNSTVSSNLSSNGNLSSSNIDSQEINHDEVDEEITKTNNEEENDL